MNENQNNRETKWIINIANSNARTEQREATLSTHNAVITLHIHYGFCNRLYRDTQRSRIYSTLQQYKIQ